MVSSSGPKRIWGSKSFKTKPALRNLSRQYLRWQRLIMIYSTQTSHQQQGKKKPKKSESWFSAGVNCSDFAGSVCVLTYLWPHLAKISEYFFDVTADDKA